MTRIDPVLVTKLRQRFAEAVSIESPRVDVLMHVSPELDAAVDAARARIVHNPVPISPPRITDENYVFNPRHSNNPEVYVPARKAFLAQIAEASKRDRERNPAYIRHMRYLASMQDTSSENVQAFSANVEPKS
jgi:hypothetical protein